MASKKRERKPKHPKYIYGHKDGAYLNLNEDLCDLLSESVGFYEAGEVAIYELKEVKKIDFSKALV